MNVRSIAKRNEYRQRNYAQTQGARNTRKEWTESEDSAITLRGVNGRAMTDRELSEYLGRSMQAIQIRRSRIGGAK